MSEKEDLKVGELEAILNELRVPIAEKYLKSKKRKNATLRFCPWYRVNKILDDVTGGRWHYEIVDKTITTNIVSVTVRITIVIGGTTIYREGTGIEPLDIEAFCDPTSYSYGDPQSNAESMAFRRAAARFGLGLHLYEKDDIPDEPKAEQKPAQRRVSHSTRKNAPPSKSDSKVVITKEERDDLMSHIDTGWFTADEHRSLSDKLNNLAFSSYEGFKKAIVDAIEVKMAAEKAAKKRAAAEIDNVGGNGSLTEEELERAKAAFQGYSDELPFK